MTDERAGDDAILVTVEHGVGWLRLNRPGVANALDLATADRFAAAVRRLADDPDVAAVLVSGVGNRFCAGGDMGWLAAQPDRAQAGRALADRLDAAFGALADLPKPVVAAVHGVVAGAGVALMLSCDVVVAEHATRFTPAYPAVGLTPDTGLSWLLPRAVGSVRALDLMLTNRMLTAHEALTLGLVARLVDDGAAQEVGAGLASALAAGPAQALGRTKLLVRRGLESARTEHGRLESETIAQMVVTRYATEAIDRFRRDAPEDRHRRPPERGAQGSAD